MKKWIKILSRTIIALIILGLLGPLSIFFSGKLNFKTPWKEQERKSAKINLVPNNSNESVVQVYTARVYSWKGAFAVHCWIALREKNEKEFNVYQVLDWNPKENKPLIDIKKDIPDRIWFGNKPVLLFEKRGQKANKIIKEIKIAAQNYPYKNEYRVWPGPNSNTFVAYIIKNSPSLNIRLPVTAIGKDYNRNIVLERSISKTGYQVSLRGIFGITVAKKEGIEINLLSFSYSINKIFPYIHLPGID